VREKWGSVRVSAGRCLAGAGVEKRAVDGLGLRRRIGAELVREEATAPLIDAERLRSVTGGGVRLHQATVARLAEGLQRDHLLGPARRLRGIVRPQARVGEDAQRADPDLT